MTAGRTLTAAFALMALCGVSAAAQLDRTTVPTRSNPREALEAPPTTSILPSIDLDEEAGDVSAADGASFYVGEIEFDGATVFDAADFAPLSKQYAGRELSFQELLQLRDQATLMYVNRGYLTSGATIGPLQDGVLTLHLVEGTLTEIQVAGESRFSEQYLREYLEGFGPLDPVNVLNLEERLQILQTDAHIDRVEAQLLPGERRGESVLYVRPYEAEPLSFLVEANNHLSPAVGSGQILASMDYLNARGRGDDLHLGIRASEGLTELAADYRFPVGRRGAAVSVYAFGANSEIVKSPFDDLDIEAKTRTYGSRFSRPLTRDLTTRSELYLTGEWRESKTYLLGSGFSFVPGPEDGEVQLAVLRTGWERTRRSRAQVLAARVQLSFGLDAFGATSALGGSSSATPDAEFIVFLGQLQWARRVSYLQSQFIARLDVQLADGPLFGMEQMPIGGRWTVRGYRENTLIRDSGVIGSLEWRVPVITDAAGLAQLEVGPFIDWSYSWNENRRELGPQDIGSAGLGLKWKPLRNTEFELYWGFAFEDIDYPSDDDLQDDGLHLRLRWWGG
jgi:hemolysin activation/secretion protein